MTKYKIKMIFPDGTESIEDEVYDTYEEAEYMGLDNLGAYEVGGEILHLSNPGDYPLDDSEDDADFEIIEVEE